MTASHELQQSTIALIGALSEDELVKVLEFPEFQQFRRRKRTPGQTPYRPIALGGLLAGTTISDEDIVAVRREMWRSFGDPDQ